MAGPDLAASRRSLKQGIQQRKAVEGALKQNQQRYKALLAESLAVETHLRRLTHQAITAQEGERRRISHELRDEIGQTLLAINVRLLSLRRAAKGDTASLKEEIASTQRLVRTSLRSVEQFAQELIPYKPGLPPTISLC